MRNSHLAGAALALTLSIPAVAGAQRATTVAASNQFGVTAGMTIPTGDLGNAVNTGYNVGLLYAMHSPTTPMGFRLDGQFHEMSWQDQFGQGIKHRIFDVTGNVTYDLAPSTSGGLYVIGGLGYYGTYEAQDSNTSDKTWSWGLNGGAGYKMKLSGMDAFIEARYHALLNDNDKERFVPISFGIAF